jgi:hypothetical protein
MLVVTKETNNKEEANRQTHMQETAKLTKKNTDGNVQSVTTCKKRQKTSEADSFRNMKIKISTHLKMAI